LPISSKSTRAALVQNLRAFLEPLEERLPDDLGP
jgi:hypothetical protein